MELQKIAFCLPDWVKDHLAKIEEIFPAIVIHSR